MQHLLVIVFVFVVVNLTPLHLYSQPDHLYRQLELIGTGIGDDYSFRQMTSLDDRGTILVYPNKQSFYAISIPDRTATELATPEILKHFDFFFARRNGSGVCGYLYSTSTIGFTWDPDLGITAHEMPDNANRQAALTEDGPMADPGSGTYSIDCGSTWTLGDRRISGADWNSPTGALIVSSPVAVNRNFFLRSERPDSLIPAWSRLQFSPAMVRRYTQDSIVALTRSALYVGAFGDTVFKELDTLLVEGRRRHIRPLYIETLADNSILYCDRNGWYGIMRRGRIDTIHSINVNGLFDYLPHTRSTAYWLEPLSDSCIVYKVSLSATPLVTSYRLPFEFRYLHPSEYAWYQTCFGEYGFCLSSRGAPDYIVDTHGSSLVVLMTGSIAAQAVRFLRDRRMVYAWSDDQMTAHVLDDCGNAIVVDSTKVGLLTHPFVLFSQEEPSVTKGPFQRSRGWRETGTPLPTRWNSSLVFPGPVIRRFSLDGRLLDTLVRVPVCFASTIDDSILVTGTKGVVRFQTATRFDTTLLASASNIVAETIGYPSSMTRARDGALVLTLLGTSFLHRDSAESVKRRWGGIVRSTNDGKTWTTVSIPSTGSYVMHCARTTSGALVASTMLMVEDSTHPVDVNAPESYYTASNIEILLSSDNGQTWSITGTAFYSGPFQPCTGNIIETAPGALYAATLAGVMISSDDGRTWSTDDQLPSTALPASVSRGSGGILVATTQGVYELPTTTSVSHEINVMECRPIAVNKAALRQIMQQHNVDQLILCDINGRMTTLTLSPDLAALPLGLYTVLSSDIAAVLSSVLIVE